MKKIYTILVFIFCSLTALAQTPPYKNADTLVAANTIALLQYNRTPVNHVYYSSMRLDTLLAWLIRNGSGAHVYPNARIPYGNGVTAGGVTDANFLRNANAFSAKSVDPTDAGSYSKIAITGLNGADTYFQKASSNGAVAQVDASKRIDNSNLQMAVTVVDSLGTVNEIGIHPDSVYINAGSNNTRLTVDGATQTYRFNKLGGTGDKVVGVRNNGTLVDTTISAANDTANASHQYVDSIANLKVNLVDSGAVYDTPFKRDSAIAANIITPTPQVQSDYIETNSTLPSFIEHLYVPQTVSSLMGVTVTADSISVNYLNVTTSGTINTLSGFTTLPYNIIRIVPDASAMVIIQDAGSNIFLNGKSMILNGADADYLALAWNASLSRYVQVGGNNYWATNGNNASSTDFIGTTNSQSLRFRVNNASIGRLNGGSNSLTDSSIVAFGYQADSLGTGSDIVDLGFQAGLGCKGDDLVLLGFNAGASLDASGNSWMGVNGGYDVGIGHVALSAAITHNTVAIGYQSGYKSVGDRNVYIGQSAGACNATGGAPGFSNICIGYAAGMSTGTSQTGNYNIYLGDSVGTSIVGGDNNIWIGKQKVNFGSPFNNSLFFGSITNTVTPTDNQITFGDEYQKLYLKLNGGSNGDVLTRDVSGLASWQPSAAIAIDSSIFVTKSGNDATGAVHDVTHPFLTVAAAVAAANAANAISNTVIVYPGVYEESIPISLYNNLNFDFIGQGTLQLLTSNHNPLFRDTVTNDTSIISASGWTFEGRAVSQEIFQLSHAGTVLTASVKKMINSDAAICDVENGGNITINGEVAHTFSTFRGPATFYSLSSTMTLNIGLIQSDGDGYQTLEFDHSSVYITSDKIYTNGNGGNTILCDDGDSSNVISITAKEIIGGDSWAIWILGKSQHVTINANTITGKGTCTVVCSENTRMTLKGATVYNTRTSSTYGILHAETNGILTAISCKTVRSAIGGSDLKTDANGGYSQIQLIGTSFDIIHTNIGQANSIQQWNGTDFVPLPKILNSISTDSILNSAVEQDTVNFASFPRCYIKNSIIKNSTITFTDSDQVIDGQIWMNDTCVNCSSGSPWYATSTDIIPKDTTKNVGIGTTIPDASAQLDVSSITKGFLPPRMTGTQAEAISSPAEGLIIYSTDGSGTTITSKGWWGWSGATWEKLN